MDSVHAILNIFGPTQREQAITLGVGRTAVAGWSKRCRIAPDHWKLIIAKAAELGVAVTAELLLEVCAPMEKRGRPPLHKSSAAGGAAPPSPRTS